MLLKDWVFLRHTALVCVPVAVAFLLPLALLAAQRPGRGIRPWWVTCRYLAWTGFFFAIAAMVTGFARLKPLGLPVATYAQFMGKDLMARHQGLALVGILAAVLTLISISRRRNEHLGLGLFALIFGWLWCGCFIGAAWYAMTWRKGKHPTPPQEKAPVVATPEKPRPPKPVPALKEDKASLIKLLDYASLIPMQPDPIKVPAHGKRWGRVWVSPGAEEAYKQRTPLPEGAWVVMACQEDRWGRPGPQPGPFYAMEQKNGKQVFTFYWSQIPEDKRAEMEGQSKAYWHSSDPHLSTCLTCHQNGWAEKPKFIRRGWRYDPPKPAAAPVAPVAAPTEPTSNPS